MILARRKVETGTTRTLGGFAARAQKAAQLKGEVSVLLTDNREIQQLNRDFRHKNKPTDVLSFPSDAPGMAGDIAISLDIATENGERLGHGLLTELKVLVLHGVLHLAGYDHEADGGEMAALEQTLRAKLGLEHGLIERANGKPAKKAARKLAKKSAPAKPSSERKAARKAVAVSRKASAQEKRR